MADLLTTLLLNLNWFIFFILIAIFFVPAGLYGYASLYVRIRNFLRARAGWMKGRKRMSNLYWKEFWMKPTGRKFKMKMEEGIDMEIPLNIEEGYLGMEKKDDSDPSKVSKDLKKKKEKKIKEIGEKLDVLKEMRGKLTPDQIELLRGLITNG